MCYTVPNNGFTVPGNLADGRFREMIMLVPA